MLSYAQWSRDYRREQVRRAMARDVADDIEAALVKALPDHAWDILDATQKIKDKNRPLSSTYQDYLAGREEWT